MCVWPFAAFADVLLAEEEAAAEPAAAFTLCVVCSASTSGSSADRGRW